MREFASSSMQQRLGRLWSELGLAVSAGLILAILGPFHTWETALLSRIGYWIALSALWFVVAALVESWIETLPGMARLPPAYRLLLVVALAGLPMLIPVVSASRGLEGDEIDLLCVPQLYPKVLLVGAGLSLLSIALFSEHGSELRASFWRRSQAPAPSGSGEAREDEIAVAGHRNDRLDCPLRSKLPVAMRETICCLEMEDHYVRVHDDRTSALILMRLTDAIDALGEGAGLRVHRSWWVACDAVTAVVRHDRGLKLELVNGLSVPVSQSYRKAVLGAFGAPA